MTRKQCFEFFKSNVWQQLADRCVCALVVVVVAAASAWIATTVMRW